MPAQRRGRKAGHEEGVKILKYSKSLEEDSVFNKILKQ
jgi:hypothetical protein